MIAGGLGFIGSNLAIRLVEEGADVTLVDCLIPDQGGGLFNVNPIHNRVTLDFTDVRDTAKLSALIKHHDFLFNLVGATSHMDSMVNPMQDLALNAFSQLCLLEVCKNVNPDIFIVYASTRQIYGRPRYLPVDESHPIAPVDINGVHKFAAEQYHDVYGEVYGLQSCLLRLTNTYGPRMRVKDARQTFLGLWLANALTAKPIEVWGGDQRRDFNYVDDCIDALLLAASSRLNGKVLNLGSNEVITLKSLAVLLKELIPDLEYDITPYPESRRAIDIGDYFGDITKIATELGWQPQVDLREGLSRTIAFLEMHINEYL